VINDTLKFIVSRLGIYYEDFLHDRT
jgi:hypothetical protein